MTPHNVSNYHPGLLLKAVYCLLVIAFSSIHLTSQIHQCQVGIHTEVSHAELIRFTAKLDGAAAYEGATAYQLGIGIRAHLNDHIYFQSGLRYSGQAFRYSYIDGNGNEYVSASAENVHILSIPLQTGLMLKHQFFLSGAFLLDFDISKSKNRTIDSQTGLGIEMQFGKTLNLGRKTQLNCSPVLQIHGLLPFHPENYHQRATMIGLRFELLQACGFNKTKIEENR